MERGVFLSVGAEQVGMSAEQKFDHLQPARSAQPGRVASQTCCCAWWGRSTPPAAAAPPACVRTEPHSAAASRCRCSAERRMRTGEGEVDGQKGGLLQYPCLKDQNST